MVRKVVARIFWNSYISFSRQMFLNSLTNRTIEISFSKLNDYKVSYSKYLELREDRILKQSQAKKSR